MLRKVNCIEIPVSNMVESVAFYEEVLGLDRSYDHPVWTSFDIGGTSFALAASGTKGIQEDAEICRSCTPCVLRYAASQDQQKGKPTASCVIYLSVDNLEGVYQALKDKGVRFLSGPHEQAWGSKTAVMLDPDLNILVLTE
jgi:catechol 2,3-dioxygenase-like lactoylglutathione lyase family enzyme